MIEIVRLKESSEQAVTDINKLLPQLRSDPSEHRGTLADLREIMNDPTAILMVAKDSDRIIGMGLLYTIVKVGKRSGSIEDIVVDEAHQGKGLGRRLMEALLEVARKEKLGQLYLTTRPERVAAHKLYESLRFEQVETDVFRLEL